MAAIVLDENTLGIPYPNDSLQILRASVIRGASHRSGMGTCYFNPVLMAGQWRPATEQDFEDFMVQSQPSDFEENYEIPPRSNSLYPRCS